MFEKFRKTPLMYWSLELLIVATLIWVCTKIDFLFTRLGRSLVPYLCQSF